jgi:hypothetical protein
VQYAKYEPKYEDKYYKSEDKVSGLGISDPATSAARRSAVHCFSNRGACWHMLADDTTRKASRQLLSLNPGR